jgi:hypothetical protein
MECPPREAGTFPNTSMTPHECVSKSMNRTVRKKLKHINKKLKEHPIRRKAGYG